MKVLVGCEFSGICRDAIRARGINAISCDLLDSERPGPHIKADIFSVIKSESWDAALFFWPCTHLAVSGARWFKFKQKEQKESIEGARKLLTCGIHKIALENPISVLSSHIRKPDQIIQPWMFGHPETKATCLWLINFPLLQPTNIVPGRTPRVHFESPGPERWKNRSRILPGIAQAIAKQWF